MKGTQIVPAVALIVSATFIGGTPGASAASETTLTIATGQISTLNPFLAFFDSELNIPAASIRRSTSTTPTTTRRPILPSRPPRPLTT